MEGLNFHHLHYFWKVARAGSMSRAARELQISQPTISAQLKALEQSLGAPLFDRSRRRLQLTGTGRMVLDHAEEIFSIGRDLVSAVRQRATDRPLPCRVGVTDSLPKLVARELLEPALTLQNQSIRLVCHEGPFRKLTADLALHRLDLVLCASPMPGPVPKKVFSIRLGTSDLTLFARPALADRLKRDFPASLSQAPALLPATGTGLRVILDHWFRSVKIRPAVIAEFDDSALMKVFAQNGHGFFVGHSIIAEEIMRTCGVKPIRRLTECRQSFHVLAPDRGHRHPALQAVLDAAKLRVSAWPRLSPGPGSAG